jgi:hypothetical protein
MGVVDEIGSCAYAAGTELVAGQFKHSVLQFHLGDIIQVNHIDLDLLEGFQLSFILRQIPVALHPRFPKLPIPARSHDFEHCGKQIGNVVISS